MTSGAVRWRLVCAALLGAAVLVAATGSAWGGPVGGCVGALAAIVGERRAATRRRAERSRAIRWQLPDALDLLAAVVDGGAAPGTALTEVCGRLPGAFGDAVSGAIAGEIDGIGVRVAEEDPSLRPLGALLRQSEELGVPVAAALRLLAADARQRLRSELRERAAAASPRMLLVVGTLLAPAALLVVIGGQVLALRGIAGGAVP